MRKLIDILFGLLSVAVAIILVDELPFFYSFLPYMDKPISRRAHAFTDYSYVPLVSSAPDLVGFKEEKTAATLCHVLSSTVLISSLFTRAEWGPIRVMSYKAHLAIDTLGGLTALTAPWVFGFAKNKKARNTFLVMGVFGLVAGLLSKPEEMPKNA